MFFFISLRFSHIWCTFSLFPHRIMISHLFASWSFVLHPTASVLFTIERVFSFLVHRVVYNVFHHSYVFHTLPSYIHLLLSWVWSKIWKTWSMNIQYKASITRCHFLASLPFNSMIPIYIWVTQPTHITLSFQALGYASLKSFKSLSWLNLRIYGLHSLQGSRSK